MKVSTVKNTCNRDQYEAILRQNGYTFAGSGCYGVVYKKGNHVIKVFNKNHNDAYLAFVEAVAATGNNDNPWFPKFNHLMTCSPKHGEEWCAVQMERLVEVKHNSRKYGDFLEIVNDIDFGSNLDGSIRYAEAVGDKTMKEDRLKELDALVLRLTNRQNHMNDAWVVLKDIFKRFSPDIHSGNLMVRKNGEYVITDPVC